MTPSTSTRSAGRSRTPWILSATCSAVLLAMTLPTFAADGPLQAKIEDLAWLTGCWASTTGEPGSGEQWSAPAGGSMLGTGRTIKDSKTVAYEFLVIHETSDGGVVYIASPNGEGKTAFGLVFLEKRAAIFENPNHDFPQRLIYKLEQDGTLSARIEGKVKDEQRGVGFAMKKVSCVP